MADAATDILMKVVGPSGPVRTDSMAAFQNQEKSGNLMTGFQTLFMCELREFSFEVGARSSLGAADKKKEARAHEVAVAAQPGGIAAAPVAPIKPSVQEDTLVKAGNDTPDMQPIEFTRFMDSASVRLMNLMVKCTTLPSISIVKRKAAGTRNGGEAYLRLDFLEVLLTGLSWKESNDVIEETGTFIYRKLKVRYRPQAADGALQPEIETSWDMKS